MLYCHQHSVQITSEEEFRDHIRLWHSNEKVLCPVCTANQGQYSTDIYHNFVLHLNRHSVIERHNVFGNPLPPPIVPPLELPSPQPNYADASFSLPFNHIEDLTPETNTDFLEILTGICILQKLQ